MTQEQKQEKKLAISFDEISDVKKFIHETKSDMYGGNNTSDERVVVMLEQGVGMSVRTYQENGWIRLDEYDADGCKELETFNGRWNK